MPHAPAVVAIALADNTITKIAPAVGALKMTYDPALFLTDKQGLVTDRLDGVFDAEEIVERLSAIVG